MSGRRRDWTAPEIACVQAELTKAPIVNEYDYYRVKLELGRQCGVVRSLASVRARCRQMEPNPMKAVTKRERIAELEKERTNLTKQIGTLQADHAKQLQALQASIRTAQKESEGLRSAILKIQKELETVKVRAEEEEKKARQQTAAEYQRSISQYVQQQGEVRHHKIEQLEQRVTYWRRLYDDHLSATFSLWYMLSKGDSQERSYIDEWQAQFQNINDTCHDDRREVRKRELLDRLSGNYLGYWRQLHPRATQY